MKPIVREALSLVIGLTGIAMLGLGMTNVLDTGTCASGGSYTVARQCPAGSGLWSLLLPLGFFVWFAGLFVSRNGLVKPGAGQIIWSAGFGGGGIALLVNALTNPSLGPGSALGSYIMAGVFIPLGLGIWAPALLRLRRDRRPAPAAPPRSPATAHPPSDRLAWLKELNRLRSGGALTRPEYDRLKAEPAADKLALIRQLADLRASGVLTADEFDAKKHTVLYGDPA